MRQSSKLQNSARNKQAIEKINNRNKGGKQHSPERSANNINTIESRTRSMLNAIQGKSIFAGPEESIFSSTDADKTNIQTKLHSKLA